MRKRNKILAAAAFFLCAGCTVRVGPLPPPPLFVGQLSAPVVVVGDSIDYWGDGIRCYYYDDVYRQYFFWNGGVRVWMDPLWAPQPYWHHRDNGWRSLDRGWRGGDWDHGPVHAGR